ncbi:uncharacterized protein Tco025E_00436 [Trypanosoma conorhini]|uniref:Uncharacterized protein n=1 Tax=Trypanosoma conorhini TaxID=83891 RepID=A0A3R7PLQ0_9TRYP|nr:uncharacterized protein Tco025E_00436 [Trypanosoma conorhini]RNF27245.1 hypothetical protein Tco025E_00436 [Trypanosoma conorhini]
MKENRAFPRQRRSLHRRHFIRVFLLLSVASFVYLEFIRTPKECGAPPPVDDYSDAEAVDRARGTAPSQSALYEEDSALWGFTGGIESLLEGVVARKYWGPAMMADHEGSLDEWTVTNVSCTRLTSLGVTEEEMRRRYVRHRKVKDLTGCDALSVPFNPRQDRRCINFMTNSSNWGELVPISQSMDQRTIKFGIVFNSIRDASGEVIQQPLETIIKVPQRLFPLEPVGEVAAFHADRLLLTHRVPPTGWACLPLSMFEASVAKYKHLVETNAEFLRASGVASYEEWVRKDLFDYVPHSQFLVRSTNGDDCIAVSIQLKIADVGHFLSSVMRIPYNPHSDTWHAFFDINNLTGEDVVGFIRRRSYAGVLHLATLSMFDYVVGNLDRSPNKNNFVVGATRVSPTASNNFMLHPNHPTFVYLDHGMTFYRRRPRRNPLTTSYAAFRTNGTATFCLFNGPLLRRIRELTQYTGGPSNETVFAWRMKQRLPRRIYRTVGDEGLLYCSKRGSEILSMAEHCLKNERIRPYVLFP